MEKGKFIVFEGIDGCGKTTQLELTFSYLWNLSKYIDIYATREPTRNFKEIRERLSSSQISMENSEWFSEAFVRDRNRHVLWNIEPMLEKGTHVICDRYKYSTLAYQSTQGVSLGKLIDMHKGLLVPDLTLLIDLPVEVAFERRKIGGVTDVFDRDYSFQERLRQTYLNLAECFENENIALIKGVGSKEEVFQRVKLEIDKIISEP